MDSEELEIEIDASGQVRVHVKGRPGPACLDYIEVFRTLLEGRITDTERTPEYYQSTITRKGHGVIAQHVSARNE